MFETSRHDLKTSFIPSLHQVRPFAAENDTVAISAQRISDFVTFCHRSAARGVALSKDFDDFQLQNISSIQREREIKAAANQGR